MTLLYIFEFRLYDAEVGVLGSWMSSKIKDISEHMLPMFQDDAMDHHAFPVPFYTQYPDRDTGQATSPQLIYQVLRMYTEEVERPSPYFSTTIRNNMTSGPYLHPH